MAYNNYNHSNREWDQGKGYGYDPQDGTSNRVHPREEDYNEYAGGTEKRRKYDNGVRHLLLSICLNRLFNIITGMA
jgi:hypothetical protein